jgi:lipopolysaccharide export system protein LptA
VESKGERVNLDRKIYLLLVVFAFFFFSVSGEAQKKAGRGDEKKPKTEKGFGFTASRAPIDVTSDTVEANQKENTVTFKGNVIAKQEETTLYANTVVIYYDPNTKGLKEITAMGNVKVVQSNRRATGQKVTFNQDQNKVVLDGEAVVREGDNVIRGERITFYVDEERSVVEPTKGGRVSTSITPPPKERDEK